MNYKNRKLLEIAQRFGYTTAKDFAKFLKLYKPSIEKNESGKEFLHLSLI